MIMEDKPYCEECGKNISYSPSGKILEEDGRSIHDCPYLKCKYCGVFIKFIPGHVSESGKPIPVTKKTGNNHRCKARPFNKETRRAYAIAHQQED